MSNGGCPDMPSLVKRRCSFDVCPPLEAVADGQLAAVEAVEDKVAAASYS